MLVATLTRELVSIKWAAGFRELRLPPNSATSVYSGMPFDHARNTACENMLANGFEWLFFLDDDVVCPPHTVERLIANQRDIISGLYYRRAEPIVPVAMHIDRDGKAQWVTSWNPPGSTVEVDLVGAGCLLIHRRVLERMKPPWFTWQMGRETESPRKFSEDFAFCQKAKAEFFKVFLDTSLKCEHVGLGQSQDGGAFVPVKT